MSQSHRGVVFFGILFEQLCHMQAPVSPRPEVARGRFKVYESNAKLAYLQGWVWNLTISDQFSVKKGSLLSHLRHRVCGDVAKSTLQYPGNLQETTQGTQVKSKPDAHL